MIDISLPVEEPTPNASLKKIDVSVLQSGWAESLVPWPCSGCLSSVLTAFYSSLFSIAVGYVFARNPLAALSSAAHAFSNLGLSAI